MILVSLAVAGIRNKAMPNGRSRADFASRSIFVSALTTTSSSDPDFWSRIFTRSPLRKVLQSFGHLPRKVLDQPLDEASMMLIVEMRGTYVKCRQRVSYA
jgi:hypothetical protein